MKQNKENTDLVVDNKEFRQQQQERLISSTEKMGNGLNEIGNYIKETKKYQKLSLWIGIGMFGIILISLIGGLFIIGKDDVKSMFVDVTRIRNIECQLENNQTIIIKSFEELSYFKETFKNSICNITKWE